MWILPKQLHTSAYAPDTKALDLDSEAFSQICEKSLSWRGKDSLSRTWLQRWKRENWMKHLCTRTLKPSHTESFEDAWTSSLVAFRANHSVLLESVKLLKTQDTSSLTSQTELESANLELFSSKTYKESSVAPQGTENQFSNMSSEHWKKWVIEQRQEYSQRKKLAHLINAKESLSWGTPNTMDMLPPRSSEALARAKKKGGCKNLREEVMQPQNWPTASVAGCVEGGVAKNVEMTTSGFKATRENGTSYGAKLRDAVIHHEENWPTVTVGEEKYRIKGNSQASKCLSAMAIRGELGHPDQAKLNTSGKSRESWPTPRETMSRDATYDRGKGNLGEVAQGKLNPDWVEHLMGLPAGWTDLGSWETE